MFSGSGGTHGLIDGFKMTVVGEGGSLLMVVESNGTMVSTEATQGGWRSGWMRLYDPN